jgi:hypothetical protein
VAENAESLGMRADISRVGMLESTDDDALPCSPTVKKRNENGRAYPKKCAEINLMIFAGFSV